MAKSLKKPELASDLRDSNNRKVITMLLGKTGHGKSSTGNSILMREDFLRGDSANSVTPEFQAGATKIDNEDVHVLDTRGLCDTSKDTKDEAVKKILTDLEAAMANCEQGVDCFILIFNYAGARYTQEEESAVNALKNIFSEDMFKKYMIILFTHKDSFDKEQKRKPKSDRETWDQWCRRQTGGLKDLLKLCEYRSIIFENLYDTDIEDGEPSREEIAKHEAQRRELLTMIHRMRSANKQKRYTSKLFDEAAEARQRMQEQANFEVIHPDVLNKLGLLRERLGRVLLEFNGEDLMTKIDEVKDDGRDLIQLIDTHENKFGFLDGIKETVSEFVEKVNNKGDAETILKEMDKNDKDLRATLTLPGIVTGLSSLGEKAIQMVAKRGGAAAATAGTATLSTGATLAISTGAGIGAVALCALGSFGYYKYKEYKSKKKLEQIETMRNVKLEEYKRSKKQEAVQGPEIVKEILLKNGQKLIICKGNITELKTEAIVNPTSAKLGMFGAVSKALLATGGDKFKQEIEEVKKAKCPLPTSEAVSCRGFNLPDKLIINVNTPSWHTPDSQTVLAKSVQNVLKLATEKYLKTLAFPALGSGTAGFPADVSACIVLTSIANFFQTTEKSDISEIYVVLFDSDTVDIYNNVSTIYL